MFPLWTFHLYVATLLASPAYGVYISQLIRYSRACGSYQEFLDRGLLLTRKLLNHFESFTLATMTWLTVTEHIYHKWPRICSICRKHLLVLSAFTNYYRVCNYINKKGTTSGAGSAGPSGAPRFTPVISGIRVTRTLASYVCFVDGCFSFCTFCCLFFDIRILIALLISLISS